MPQRPTLMHPAAWYHGTREAFLATPRDEIANQLAGRAAEANLEIEQNQNQEWRQSVEVLQQNIADRLPILRRALQQPGNEAIRDVILEFDFRRRGLRMDCLLLADGVLFVVEFKRSRFGRSDRDQVMNYAINLIEFHGSTQQWCSNGGAIVVPVLVLTNGRADDAVVWPGFADCSWSAMASAPLQCDGATLSEALTLGLQNRNCAAQAPCREWLDSPFMPSSSILDATLSLYGNHDVVAIQEHAAPKQAIDAATAEIREHIARALKAEAYHIVFLSGAPGAGKTLVGLDLVMRGPFADQAVFVTGNAPLVEVLNKALGMSYRAQGARAETWAPTGYRHGDAQFVAAAASYKIVKAHNFLGRRGRPHGQADGRVLVFDEAQRTYEKGRVVGAERLADHEADLILGAQMDSYPVGGAIVVALVGHNQAINRGERGMVAWLDAAERRGWSFSIADETLQLEDIDNRDRWRGCAGRWALQNGHLRQSMRYYRNAAVEGWVAAVLDDDAEAAQTLARNLDKNGSTIWMTRNLGEAREWARSGAIGGQRVGLIASGQARRLAAEGLFVDYKPDIATWMLAPTSDVRSSNALETVQNQYQIQGLELDYCIVCWDADLRRQDHGWAAYKLSGTQWQSDKFLEVAKNSYRVLLTRARKGIVIFVPKGDLLGRDATRNVAFYDDVAEFLVACGARELLQEASSIASGKGRTSSRSPSQGAGP